MDFKQVSAARGNEMTTLGDWTETHQLHEFLYFCYLSLSCWVEMFFLWRLWCLPVEGFWHSKANSLQQPPVPKWEALTAPLSWEVSVIKAKKSLEIGWSMSVIQRVNSGIEQMVCSWMQCQQAASGYKLFCRDKSLPSGVQAILNISWLCSNKKLPWEGWLEDVLSAWYFLSFSLACPPLPPFPPKSETPMARILYKLQLISQVLSLLKFPCSALWILRKILHILIVEETVVS